MGTAPSGGCSHALLIGLYFKLDDEFASFNLSAVFSEDTRNFTFAWAEDVGFHLHGFENDEWLVFFHFVAFGHEDLDDGAWDVRADVGWVVLISHWLANDGQGFRSGFIGNLDGAVAAVDFEGNDGVAFFVWFLDRCPYGRGLDLSSGP